ncbi:unnamed protein product [Sphenostylis stenocarpa]|uniref:CRM domain-containing protein n=1 Tax=Sphenostylis stenocarpa TaxID=92480 RepID=A0AA86S8K0_9FABA|nr:unnamed protein product [Sphenostylis stenocarpa]
MLLPVTQFHFFHTFPSSPSSHFFPLQFPKTKTKTKFLVRCSTSNSRTRIRTRPSSAIEQIAEKLRSLGITESPPSSSGGENRVLFPHELPKQGGGQTFEPSWSTPLNPVPVPGSGIAAMSASEVERRRKRREEELRRRREMVPTLAELSLPNSEIRRLTTLGFAARRKVRLAKAGVTERIVNVIHELWERSEVVRILCEEFCRFDMRRTHDLLERKTGGLVVWRSGTKVILYRGTDYKYPNYLSDKVLRQDNPSDDTSQLVSGDGKYCDKSESHLSESKSAARAVENSNFETAKPALILGVGTPNKVRFQLPDEAELAEDTGCLLMGLGPRFTDWWGCDPLPVDADLLPAVDPGYRKPFRLLPYGVNPKLSADEMTTLKRLGRPLPSHFALGRNRNLQGLAAAIIRLWERCEIVKIAIKRGVQNTSSKIMAKELKRLTGGILLSRDREFFVFYRGKDYLPATVSSVIKKQRKIRMHKLKAGNSSSAKVTPEQKEGTIECDSEVKVMNFQKDTKRQMLTKAELAIKRIGIKFSMALEKKAKAEKRLADIINAESPQEQELDKEGITKEEKYMLRRIGRRGVFDGTVENMHLHWKYRELVKIICKGSLEDVYQIALTLEAESGGILVAVVRVRKGFAIIVYRGKNYSAPPCVRPQKLLNKRQALKRSIEAQRRESLKRRILMLDKKIKELKLQMVEDKEANSNQIVEAFRFDMATDKQDACANSINWNSPKEASAANQQTIQGQPVELTDGGGPHQGEQENSINWNSPTEASVDNQQAIQEQPIELIDGCGANDGEPNISINLNSPKEASLENLKATVEHPVELIDGCGAHQDEPKNSIYSNSPKDASVDKLQGIQYQPDELIDSGGAHQGEPENTTSWNSSIKASISNLLIQEKAVAVELIDGGGARQDEPKTWSSLIHKETQLDEMSDSVADTEHCISNSNKAMEPSDSSSKNDLEPSVPVINMSFPSRSLHFSTKDRLLLRKQALKMKQPVVSIGKSNIVSAVVQTIKAHFEHLPFAIVNVKGRAKGTSVQELVFKLEQETGSLLVSREPSNIILYRGWPADEPIPAINEYVIHVCVDGVTSCFSQMLLPATHFHSIPSSSSPLHIFPLQFPKPKLKFLIRCSDTQTLPDSAIQRIADKLRTLGIADQPSDAPLPDPPSGAGEIFVPLPQHLPKRRVGHTIDPSWAKPEKRVPTLAELSLSNAEISRLTTAGLRMRQKLRVGKAGITEGIVNGIHERWRSSEVVKIACDDLSRFNMKRTHDLLECSVEIAQGLELEAPDIKTGGLVVWRSGSKIILYRGTDYKYPYFLSDKVLRDDHSDDALQHLDEDEKSWDKRESHSSEKNSVTYTGQSSNAKTVKPALIQGVGTPNKARFQLPGEAELAKDADYMLTGIGPRFVDWWGYDPLPVDADLLPAVIPGYRKPFRLLPYGVKPKLTDDEMTTMRRLGKHLPCHFALGRNRKLQGLAVAIIKLWERCEIVKIAIKRGVENTNGEVMAEEIKYLTGGTLLARDKEFIVFYRGKDFLPAAVSSAIEQRRMYKLKTANSLSVTDAPDLNDGTIECDSEVKGMNFQKDAKQGILTEAEKAIKSTSVKLSMALEEKTKAEKLLAELENAESPQEEEINKEIITEDEKYMLRRIGLKMSPFLLLGDA